VGSRCFHLDASDGAVAFDHHVDLALVAVAILGDRHGSLRPRRLFGEVPDDERFEERAEPGAVGLGEIVGGLVDEVSDAPLLGSVGQTRAPAREQADEVQRFEYGEV